MHDLQAEPTADVGLARLVSAGLQQTYGKSSALARAARLPTGGATADAGRVPVAWLTNLWQVAIAQADESLLGFSVAGRWRFGHLRLTDYMFRSAPTLSDAVDGFVKYIGVLIAADNDVGTASGEKDDLTVIYQVRSGDPLVDAVASQFALGTVLRLARHAAGHDIRPLRIGFATDATKFASRIAQITGARELDFGTPATFMTLSAADLALRLPNADTTLSAVLEGHATDVLQAQGAGATWADRLRPILAAELGRGESSLQATARKLAMSPRSLQRRLNEEGTSWRDIVDALRRDRAEVLLARGLSKSTVASRLGFRDSRALRGAVRRWHGT